MTARDPVAVLREAALKFKRDTPCNLYLRALALDIEDQQLTVDQVVERLRWNEADGERTPDERAGFALAREALTAAAGGAVKAGATKGDSHG